MVLFVHCAKNQHSPSRLDSENGKKLSPAMKILPKFRDFEEFQNFEKTGTMPGPYLFIIPGFVKIEKATAEI